MGILVEFLLLLGMAHAGTILVQAPQSSTLDYRATLKAHLDLSSPTQDYLANHPSPTAREKLLNLFLLAQTAFLEKSSVEGRQRFKDVLSLLWTDDWSASDREIFLQAYLRLAQLEIDTAARDVWLSQSLTLGANVGYDSTLYPPPLITRREELAQQVPRQHIKRSWWSSDWSQVLINGQLCETDCGPRPPKNTKIRITFLSDLWLTQTKVLEADELEHYRPTTISWVEGSCNEAKWNVTAEKLTNKRAFWSLSCDRGELTSPLNLRPLSPTGIASVTEPKPPSPFYKSTWFWLGAGVVTAAVVISLTRAKKETRETSTTYGY